MRTQPEPRSAAGTMRRRGRPAEKQPRRRAGAPAAPAPELSPDSAVRAVMDMASVPMVLANQCGEVIHTNPACAALLESCGSAGTVHAEIGWRAPLLCSRAEAADEWDKSGEAAAEGEARLPNGLVRFRARVLPASEARAVVFVLEMAAAERDHICREQLRVRWGLTEQECQVARLMAQGNSDKAVARALDISAHTARHHGERVRSKLGASSRTEVAARLLSGT